MSTLDDTDTELIFQTSSSDHSTDAGRSPSSGAGSYRSISAARAQAVASGRHPSIAGKQQTSSKPAACHCRCRSTGQTDGRTDSRPLHRRLCILCDQREKHCRPCRTVKHVLSDGCSSETGAFSEVTTLSFEFECSHVTLSGYLQCSQYGNLKGSSIRILRILFSKNTYVFSIFYF